MKAERMVLHAGGPPGGGKEIPAIKLVAEDEEERQLIAGFALRQLSLVELPGAPGKVHSFTLSRWPHKNASEHAQGG